VRNCASEDSPGCPQGFTRQFIGSPALDASRHGSDLGRLDLVDGPIAASGKDVRPAPRLDSSNVAALLSAFPVIEPLLLTSAELFKCGLPSTMRSLLLFSALRTSEDLRAEENFHLCSMLQTGFFQGHFRLGARDICLLSLKAVLPAPFLCAGRHDKKEHFAAVEEPVRLFLRFRFLDSGRLSASLPPITQLPGSRPVKPTNMPTLYMVGIPIGAGRSGQVVR